jgi:hypothetical protein
MAKVKGYHFTILPLGEATEAFPIDSVKALNVIPKKNKYFFGERFRTYTINCERHCSDLLKPEMVGGRTSGIVGLVKAGFMQTREGSTVLPARIDIKR